PSAGTPTIFCHATTSGPLEPSPICACVIANGEGGDGVGAETGIVGIDGTTPGTGAPGTALVTNDPNAFAQVSGPTIPSGVTPCAACHVFVAASVFGPKMPSDLTPMSVCQSATSGPVDPFWIVVCGAVIGAGTAGGVGAGVATGYPGF